MKFKAFDLHTDAFRSAVAEYEARGGWWRVEFARGGFTGYPLRLVGGRVVIAGAGRLADTIGDKRNGRLREATWVPALPNGDWWQPKGGGNATR